MAAAENKPDSTPALDVVKLIIPDVSWTGTVGSDSHISRIEQQLLYSINLAGVVLAHFKVRSRRSYWPTSKRRRWSGRMWRSWAAFLLLKFQIRHPMGRRHGRFAATRKCGGRTMAFFHWTATPCMRLVGPGSGAQWTQMTNCPPVPAAIIRSILEVGRSFRKQKPSSRATSSTRAEFPVTLEAVVSSAADMASGGDSGSEFPRTLKLVCHHIILAAWWCCMFDAVKANDKDRITELYECILTCTIRVAVWTSDAMVVKMALAAAEHARALECTSDNVIVFAERLAIITKASSESSQQKLVDSLKQDGILYQGKPVTRNLLAACEPMCKNLTERSKAILAYLESKYGRPLLTDGPTKLYRMIVTSGKLVSNLRLRPKPVHGHAFEMLMAWLATVWTARSLPVTCALLISWLGRRRVPVKFLVGLWSPWLALPWASTRWICWTWWKWTSSLRTSRQWWASCWIQRFGDKNFWSNPRLSRQAEFG